MQLVITKNCAERIFWYNRFIMNRSFIDTPVGQAIVRKTGGHPLEDPIGRSLFQEEVRHLPPEVLRIFRREKEDRWHRLPSKENKSA